MDGYATIVKHFSPLFIFLISSALMAQQPVEPHLRDSSRSYIPATTDNICSNDAILNQSRKDPGFKAREEKMNREILNAARTMSGDTITLPVVVHIINPNPTSVTDLQVINGINNLNDAFSKSGVYSASLGVDTKIRFCLSQKDPDGGNTTGITRTQSFFSTNMNFDIEDRRLKNLMQWDPTKFINIWLVTNIRGEAYADFICGTWYRLGVGGYATMPPGGGSSDGIVVSGFGVLLAHEMGHYLGLYHTFEGGCFNNNCLLNGDRVCDTPPDNSVRPSSSCTNTQNTCNTDTLSNYSNGYFPTLVPDQIDNFMDYGNTGCSKRFTQGQADRMRAAILTQRSGLLQDECTKPCPENFQAGFTRNIAYPVTGDLINFTNTSAGATNYEWLVNGIIVSISANFSYTFPATGKYKVTLKAFNTPGCFASSTDYVIVNCGVTARFYTNKKLIASNSIYPDNIIFTNTSYNGQTYQWLMSNNQGMALQVVGTSPDLTYVFLTPATYSVRLVATNGSCSDTTEVYSIPVLDPTPDGAPYFISLFCYQQNKVRVTFCIGDFGYAPLPINTPVNFYDANPLLPTANRLSPTFYLTSAVPGGNCGVCFTHILDVAYHNLDKIYLVFNDAGTSIPVVLPNATLVEKFYTNNTISSVPTKTTVTTSICQGQNYAGHTTAGTYIDTLVSVINGCDSIRTLNLTIRPVFATSVVASICQGQNYAGHTTSGTYVDVYTATNGCDSTRTLQLTVRPTYTTTIVASICQGQNFAGYTASGTYVDVFTAVNGCDSTRTLQLTVKPTFTTSIVASICQGENYAGHTTSGTYVDVYPAVNGCDSTRTLQLTVKPVFNTSVAATICYGNNYAGHTSSGTYVDIYSASNGCDSTRTLNLTVQAFALQTINPVICEGQIYTLPWGAVAITTGVYRDTLHYTTGCDSLRRIVNLTVQAAASETTNPIICEGVTYTLPWGAVVSTAGIYQDTLRYTTGCDSVRRTVNLIVQTSASVATNPIICAGQTYTLPWGAVANTTGIYRDTLHYAITGCDSIRRTVNLTVQTALLQTTNPVICSGQTYALPWGAVANATGIYRDTLHYAITGCDSLRRIVNLTVQTPASVTLNPVICAGQTYTLPWGSVVSTAGVFYDTLHYAMTGCDSLRRIVNLTVQTSALATSDTLICAGQTYILPWGTAVNTAGIYRDTLLYTTGCDSLRRIVNLRVQSPALITINPTICQGATYTLPWGTVVSTAGTYSDTSRYTTGCDSVRRTVNLRVTIAEVSAISPSICVGETYTLPWGSVVTTAGMYKDTLRSVAGCDSLFRIINLAINPTPTITLSKSNDVNCFIGVSQLTASGGSQYQWSPAGTLSNPSVRNPVASPGATTTYQVKVTSANGCVAKDSIQVIVYTDGVNDGFVMPNAFTPNNDGKNDCFGVETWGQVSDLRLSVYNRWGELVFFTTNRSKCWDGTFKGVEQPMSIFVYQVSAKTNCGNVYREGTIALIR